jgi:hypothetical protein
MRAIARVWRARHIIVDQEDTLSLRTRLLYFLEALSETIKA